MIDTRYGSREIIIGNYKPDVEVKNIKTTFGLSCMSLFPEDTD